jgi:hypothetical protein
MRSGAPTTRSAGRWALALLGWLLLTFAASATGVFVKTGGWYTELAKPVWNPPSWVFGPVWTVLYVMMAVAAWLVWQRGGWKAQRGPLMLYVVQWALNALWTPRSPESSRRCAHTTACWPISFLLPKSRGALRAIEGALHYGSPKVVGSVVKPGPKSGLAISG